MYYSIVAQTVVLGGPQAVSEEKGLQKLYQTLNELKNTPIYVCTNTAFVG
jgi:hypothetical protein